MERLRGRLVVLKIGGSLLSTSKDYVEAARRIREVVEEGLRPLVVVSAAKGVTDELLGIARGSRDLLEPVERKHLSIARDFGSRPLYERIREELASLRKVAIGVGGYARDPAVRDYILSFGERLSRIIMEHALEHAEVKALGVDSRVAIVTDERHGDANIDYDATYHRLKPLLSIMESGVVPILEGFVGSSPQGHVTTLGRGGSDYTATSIARILGINSVYLATSVDGVYTLDPRIESNAKVINKLSVDEAIEAALYGAKGFNRKTFEPLRGTRTRVMIGSWRRFGTTVIPDREASGPKLLGYRETRGRVVVGVIGHLDVAEVAGVAVKIAEGLGLDVEEVRFSRRRPSLRLLVSGPHVISFLRRLHEALFGGGDYGGEA